MLLDIFEEHLEETEILWSRRRTAVWSPDLDLAGLEALDERLWAHIGGLALAARDNQGALEATLRDGDPDATFAASAALLATRAPAANRCVLEALTRAAPEARQGIVEALCHLPLAEESRVSLEGRHAQMGSGPSAIEVLSFHRSLDARLLEPLVRGSDPVGRRAAACAMGRVGAPAEDWIERLIEDDDIGVRDAALGAAARCGLPWTVERLRDACRDPHRASRKSIRLLACLGDAGDLDLLVDRSAREDLGEAAMDCIATLGYVEGVEALLSLMDRLHMGRAAGQAFRRITGLDPPAIAVESETTEAEEATFEDLRPMPNVEATRALWHGRARDFDSGLRWRQGRPITAVTWKAAPHRGDLLTRREELTRLWARDPERFRTLELDAPAARQRAVAA